MPTSEGRANLLLYEHAEQQGATRPGTLLGKLLFVRDVTINYLKKVRDLYKYIYDQSLRLLNQLRWTLPWRVITISLPMVVLGLLMIWFRLIVPGAVPADGSTYLAADVEQVIPLTSGPVKTVSIKEDKPVKRASRSLVSTLSHCNRRWRRPRAS
jgi:hypothetical protein